MALSEQAERVPDPRTSYSLERGAAILKCFSSGHQTLGIFEIADITGISRSTTHRYAMTLVALGYLEQDSQRRYRLAGRASDPGAAMLGAIRQEISARDALEDLRDQIGYTVSMGVLDWTRVVYLYRFFGHRAGQYTIDQNLGVGADVPVYCTALGKVLLASLRAMELRELLASLQLVPYGPRSITTKKELLAELARIDAKHAVVSNEELVSGARSIAVLIPCSESGYPLGIEVTVPSKARTANRLLREFGPRLRRTAKLIANRRRAKQLLLDPS
jgi:IclR family transcriptional regulator, pca regulon regulatory protein